jgi:hypothetical protein
VAAACHNAGAKRWSISSCVSHEATAATCNRAHGLLQQRRAASRIQPRQWDVVLV